MGTSIESAFEVVSKMDTEKKMRKATMKAQLSFNCPSLELANSVFHVKGVKAEPQEATSKIVKVDIRTNEPVVGKEVAAIYRFRRGLDGNRNDFAPVAFESIEPKTRFENGDDLTYSITGLVETRYFKKADVDELFGSGEVKKLDSVLAGNMTEVPAEFVAAMQDGVFVDKFERTKLIELQDENIIHIDKMSEYQIKDYYMLRANTDEEVNESAMRVRDLAKFLYEKRVGILCFFSFGNGYNYYTAILHTHKDEESEKMWLVLAMTQGFREFDVNWAVESHDDLPQRIKVAAPAKAKPKVSLARRS